MMDTTLYLGPDVVVTLRSALGFAEEWEPMAPVQVRNTWNGRAKVIKPTFRRKSTIRLSGAGNGVWRVPNFQMLEPGHIVTLHSCIWQHDLLPAGTLSKTLRWTPVPGSTRIRDPETDQIFEHTVVDKTVSVAVAFDRPMAIAFYAAVECLLGDVSMSGDSKTGLATWSADLHMRDA
ncbi:hypothetical protein [Devosia nitrariae]|uniref:SRPBCC family protein n=1 Tax=Devosia nitrariae TaxID=2071872 RepID=A0ABQ5W1B0_9HYPH|nr:hypothetical protein [Devosia nitrariae]GLQ53594.1 hypothetical protein GCM10010862_08530 [Devosia nitrariae]